MSEKLNPLPPMLQAALSESLQTQVLRAALLGGGMINRAARVETSDGVVFVKWNEQAPPRFFTTEANGLLALRESKALRVPQVLAVSEEFSEEPAFLALEYVRERTPRDPSQFARRFGEELAGLHRNAVSPSGSFGLQEDNYLGALPQLNTPRVSWPQFYRDCRLLPQIAIARQRGVLHAERERWVMRIMEKLEELLAGLESSPALLHGDLWSGNFLAAGEEGEQPVVIDPAVYYGEREMEIAYCELFGGFASEFFAAYRAAYPLDAGYEFRRPLHQLYHLLNHLNHFGESYGPQMDGICRNYLK